MSSTRLPIPYIALDEDKKINQDQNQNEIIDNDFASGAKNIFCNIRGFFSQMTGSRMTLEMLYSEPLLPKETFPDSFFARPRDEDLTERSTDYSERGFIDALQKLSKELARFHDKIICNIWDYQDVLNDKKRIEATCRLERVIHLFTGNLNQFIYHNGSLTNVFVKQFFKTESDIKCHLEACLNNQIIFNEELSNKMQINTVIGKLHKDLITNFESIREKYSLKDRYAEDSAEKQTKSISAAY